MSLFLILMAILVLGSSGVPGLVLPRRMAGVGQHIATALTVAGSMLGLTGAALALVSAEAPTLRLGWAIPGGAFHVAADGLSILFLVPVFLLSACCAVYGEGYWKEAEHPRDGRKLRLFYGLLAGSMGLLLIAVNGILFISAWEVMALSAFFLVSTEDNLPAVRQAGWEYLVATHLGTLALIAMLAVLRAATGGLELDTAGMRGISEGAATAVFLLSLFGFGLKAGIMPLHVWLPGAHANAPSHVSALLSGVLIKMGIYGLVRMTGLLPHPPVWWGGLLLALGVVSGVLGVAFAIGQHDLKRLLAYHSIENIGIIVIGLGLALVGRSLDRPDWVLLGLGGALLHVWNHALFKSLLFLSAGSVIHAVHTREIDHLGGLAKSMPRTAAAFMLGAAAICGLPPLNGFVSELFIYLGLFRTLGIDAGTAWPAAALAAPMLALIGALAVACFVKVYGIVFLGEPRAAHPHPVHEASAAMLGPMGMLAGLCLLIGLVPVAVTPPLEAALRTWATSGGAVAADSLWHITAYVPLAWLSVTGVLLLLLLAGLGLAIRSLMRKAPESSSVTWDCGYAAPTARMQYTASSFGQTLVDLFGWALHPHRREVALEGPFPAAARFDSHVPEAVLDRAILPAFRLIERLLLRLRFLQQGRVQLYVLYILLITLLLLLWEG